MFFFFHSPDTYLHLRQRKMLLFWKCIKNGKVKFVSCWLTLQNEKLCHTGKCWCHKYRVRKGWCHFVKTMHACPVHLVGMITCLRLWYTQMSVSSELVRTRATRDRADSVWFLAFSLSVSLLWCLWERDWEQNARRQCSFSSMSMALFRIWYSHATISVRRMWMWYLHDVQKDNVMWTTYTTVRKPYICWFRWSV